MRFVNGKYIELTPEEIAAMEAEREAAERDYWLTVDYGEAINQRIRERYTESQEFALLRQASEKPEEYAEYYAYCEECKAFVKGTKDLNYTDGYRTIPEQVTVPFAKGECGWWRGAVWESLYDNNTWNPEQFAAGWAKT